MTIYQFKYVQNFSAMAVNVMLNVVKNGASI